MTKQKLIEEAFALLARADALLEGVRERHEAKLASMLAEIDARFISGNEIEVERASITAIEWSAIRQYVSASLAARSAAEPKAAQATNATWCAVCGHGVQLPHEHFTPEYNAENREGSQK